MPILDLGISRYIPVLGMVYGKLNCCLRHFVTCKIRDSQLHFSEYSPQPDMDHLRHLDSQCFHGPASTK